MEGGRDWWLQITEALDRVEFMALVITPNALNSETVRKEWRYARQQGVCVYPIKGTPDLDFDTLPRWMSSAHFYDLDREWQKFVNDLNTRCQTRRVPFMVEDLPEGFVPRHGEFDQLLELLVDERREEPVAITAALKGAGGYGKTTLAKALCHDERIQDAFDDGILWITLGENPGDLTGRVEDLIVTLGDERPGFTTQDAAVSRLKELLADRDILIVIDDVWNRAHLNPFIQGGPRCARLITTRNFDTLPASAERVQVDAMQQDEATALLAAGLNHDESLSRELTVLASRLGEWPLLLRLVNSALRNRIENDKQSPPDAIAWINKALTKRGLTYFDAHNSAERNQAVEKTISVSLELLDAKQRQRYGELAIFPEDVEIPLFTVKKLWARTGGLDEFDTDELCSRLNRFSLLLSYDAERQRIRLHDVVRKFLIDQQLQNLPSIHAQLLDAHSPRNDWSEMSADEVYLWDNLASHLVEAGRGEELVTTVKDWRYLVAKTFIRKSLSVEADLLAAEQLSPDDAALRLLRRNFVNSGHLLNRCKNRNDIETTLFSRLVHLDELKSLTADLQSNLKRPCVVPLAKLPDLPHPALVRTLEGHKVWITACAMSTDGSTIVSASADETLRVWDARSWVLRHILSGHEKGVNGCAVSADGSTIVSASDDETLKVWNGQTGVERFTLRGHSKRVGCCAVTADGMIVSGSDDQTLKVWDAGRGAERFTLRGHTSGITGCAVSADGRMIVSASLDKTLKIWDGQSGAERFTLLGHTDWVQDCAVSANGATIVSASQDGTLKVWDGRNGVECFTLKGQSGWIMGCAMSPDAATIVSVSADNTLMVWDGRTGEVRFTLTGYIFNGCAVSPDGTTIVSGTADSTVKVWEARDAGSEICCFPESSHDDGVRGCAVSADGRTVVSASDDRTLKVWDGRSGAERLTLSGHRGVVRACAVTADGGTIVSSSFDDTLKVWDGRNGVERYTLSDNRKLRDCAISADGAIIVSAALDRPLSIWNGRTGVEEFFVAGYGLVLECAVSADGGTIVSASNDYTLKVWDSQTGIERFTLTGHTDYLMDCAVSADGTTIISGAADNTLRVWDGKSGTERLILNAHSNGVAGCAVSADATTIVSASADNSLKVWDGHTGKCLLALQVDGPLYCCACSADGEIIAAGGARGIYFLRLVR